MTTFAALSSSGSDSPGVDRRTVEPDLDRPVEVEMEGAGDRCDQESLRKQALEAAKQREIGASGRAGNDRSRRPGAAGASPPRPG